MWKKSKFFRKFPDYFRLFRASKFTFKTIEIAGETYTLREMKTKDIKEVLAVERHIYQGETPWRYSHFWFEINAPHPKIYLVVSHQDRIVGFIGCRIKQRRGHITNIGIEPAFQHRGLGGYLLTIVKQFARFQGCQELTLEVRIGNRDAQRLYRRHGFVSHSIRKNYYQAEKEDALNMICSLSRGRVS